MKKLFLFPICCWSLILFAQDEKTVDATMTMGVGGTFAKPKIVPKLNKLAIAQASIYFKNITTREIIEHERGAFGRRKTDGGSVAGRLTAYLETTDGELSQQDYQQLADGFYSYLNNKLADAGVSPVDWNTVAGTGFYQNEGIDLDDVRKDESAMKKKGQVYTVVNANNGSTLYKYNISGGFNTGFAFGKIKKASKFSEDVGAPVVFMHLTVDFADIVLDGDVRTGTSRTENMFFTKVTTNKKWKMDAEVGANIKVIANGGPAMFWNEKSQSETMGVSKDIPSGAAFASGVNQDPDKEKLRKRDNIFAKDFNMTPIVISTTKEQYKAATKKALENYADMFVAKIKFSKG